MLHLIIRFLVAACMYAWPTGVNKMEVSTTM